jgi:protein-S-isoprenylcysteine O-methyltransferase Ste14
MAVTSHFALPTSHFRIHPLTYSPIHLPRGLLLRTSYFALALKHYLALPKPATLMEWIKIYLKFYICAYFVVLFVIPNIRIYKETGINPFVFGDRDNLHDFIGMVMKILIGVVAAVIIFSGFMGPGQSYLVPVTYLERNWAMYAGMVLIHLSFFLILIAQLQMNKSWRMGIDEKNRTQLVTSGLFKISRNPIFLGIIISVIGIFLILPNMFTFAIMILTYFVIQVQVRLEEAFLEKQHGQKYLQYKQQVKRFL